MCKFLGPVTTTAAFMKDQISWTVLDPGDSIGTAVKGTRGIRFCIKPTNLVCAEVIWDIGCSRDCRSGGGLILV